MVMNASAIFPAYRLGGNKILVLKIEIRVFLPFEITDVIVPPLYVSSQRRVSLDAEQMAGL
jgi:hypothetical protein